jgi:hypothetical protein
VLLELDGSVRVSIRSTSRESLTTKRSKPLAVQPLNISLRLSQRVQMGFTQRQRSSRRFELSSLRLRPQARHQLEGPYASLATQLYKSIPPPSCYKESLNSSESMLLTQSATRGQRGYARRGINALGTSIRSRRQGTGRASSLCLEL